MSKIFCAPITGFAAMSREIENLKTGNSYRLDSRGCALVSDADDMVFFENLGFVDFTVQSIVGTSVDGNFLNLITHFGALGDGATDDGSAFVAGVASDAPLFIPPGTYNIGNSIGVPPSGKRIYGVPGRSIISKTATGTSYIHPVFNISDVTDVEIDGLSWVAVGSVREYGFIIRATTLAATKRIAVRNCTISNTPNFIQRYVDTVWIEGNTFLGGGASGALGGISLGGYVDPATGLGHPTAAEISAGPPTPADGLCQNIWITNNYFESTRQESVDINWQVSNVFIDGNVMVDAGMDGLGNETIDCGGSSSQGLCHNISITNNKILCNSAPTTATTGINIKGESENVLISGNYIYSAFVLTTYSIILGTTCSNVKIVGNHVVGFKTSCNIGTSQTNIEVSGNTFLNSGITGVAVSTGTNTNLNIANNTIKTASATGYGIDLDNVTGFRVTGNFVSGFTNTTGGILLRASATDGIVKGNVVKSCYTGIKTLSGAINNVIDGNSVSLCNQIGYSLASQHLTVTNNHSYNNSQTVANTYGFNFAAGCDYALIEGNKSYDTQGGSATQNGFNFGASDRVKYNNNIAWPVKATAENGTGTLTNSSVGTAGNIVA